MFSNKNPTISFLNRPCDYETEQEIREILGDKMLRERLEKLLFFLTFAVPSYVLHFINWESSLNEATLIFVKMWSYEFFL